MSDSNGGLPMPQTPNTPSLMLIGDSIFDNAVYVEPSERCVTDHCRALLAGWNVQLWAVDGANAADIPIQVGSQEPPSNAVAVMSVGGNDALAYQHLLFGGRWSSSNPLAELHDIREQFRSVYNRALDAWESLNVPITTCAIYNCNFPEPEMQAAATTGIALFNDVIFVESRRRALPVIDLRNVCTDPVHYANPIAPSEAGGLAIARAITDAYRSTENS